MSVFAGPKIANSGLLLCVDPSNLRSNRGKRSLINWDGWATQGVGTLSTLPTGFGSGGPNQTVAGENSLVSGTDPWGITNILWQSNPSGDSNGDGGWEGAYNSTIDNTRLYRSSVWIRRTTSTYGGNYYHGLHTNGTGDVYNLPDGASQTNPYWHYGGTLAFTQNTWYLLVGHIYPWTYTGTTAHQNSGYYVAGSSTNLGSGLNGNITDCKFPSNATTMYQRVYHYYSGDSTTKLQFFQPRIDLIDGTEPSISELINNVGSTWYDTSGNGKNVTMYNGAGYNSGITGGVMSFDGTDDYASGANLGSFPASGTISFWMYPTEIANYRNPFHTHLNAGNVGFRFEMQASGMFYVVAGNDSGTYTVGYYYSSSGLTANTWYNVVLTWNSSTNVISGYLNNTAMFTNQSNTYWPTTLPSITIGSGLGNTSDRCFKGYMSDVLIYNRVLTDTEIQRNFNAKRYKFGKL